MGQDKALLGLKDRTLLVRALALGNSVSQSVWIVGSAAKYAAFGPIVEDIYPERGPLAGIHAALVQTCTDLNVIVAVDLPFLTSSFLNYLISRARESIALVTVAKAGGHWQPLCAVYHRSFAQVAERSLRAGRNKIDPLFTEVKTEIIEPDELARNGFSEQLFRNVNTRQDWDEAMLKWSENRAEIE